MEWVLTWLLVFALLPGIISSLILEAKGSSYEGIIGFIIGFLFSYLGLFIVLIISLIMPRNEQKLKEKKEKFELKQGTVKKCPSCAEIIREEAIKCRFCGVDVSNIITEEQEIISAEHMGFGDKIRNFFTDSSF